ncbi:hypothetical protein PRZ48_014620 [Zasmidium cellare]|uniref:Transmembrane protein n=1 Tax=Zasmidium cellare TaxID=395010 RepID=A0ABR0DYS2_ZASCE|nr:hypothetical protein PRZ48_014620 [Zasmidium cellare]
MSTTYTTDLPPVGGYRPHRPQIMWATPIATAPDPFQLMLARLRETKTEKRNEVMEGRPTTIKWADPIATIADEMAGFAQTVMKHTGDDRKAIANEVVPSIAVQKRHVAWANPIATVTEDVCAEGMRRRVKMVGGEKVLLSRKRIMNGKVVVGATEQLAPATMMDLEFEAPASMRVGEDLGKMSTPIVTVREVDVEPTGRVREFIRRWKLKLGWMCDFDEKPLTEEEMCLLQLDDGAKKHPSRAPPCWAYSLACGFCVLVLGVFAWVFWF